MQTTIGSLPAQIDLVLYQGDDFFFNMKVFDSDQVPSDLTDQTAKAEIRTKPGGTLITEFDVVIDTNVIYVQLPHDQCSLLSKVSSWDIQLTDGAGVVTTLAYGSVRPTPEVTL